MRLGIVTDDAPLTVQLKGDTAGTVVQQKGSHVPALVVDDLVLVEIVDRKIVVLMKVVDA